MHVHKRHVVDQLQALANREPNRRRFIRLRALILANQGLKTLEIVDALGTLEQFPIVRSNHIGLYWISRYRDAFNNRTRFLIEFLTDSRGERPRLEETL